MPAYSGIARNPPPAITEQLKLLNDNLKIGQMLCRSRQPDFLLDIIQRQVKKDIRSFISWQFEGLTIIIYYNSNVLRELNILAFVLFVYYKVPLDNEKIFANTYYKCIFDV